MGRRTTRAIRFARDPATLPQVSILADHDATLKGVVGRGQAEIHNHRLIVAGQIAPTTDDSFEFRAMRKPRWGFSLCDLRPPRVRGCAATLGFDRQPRCG